MPGQIHIQRKINLMITIVGCGATGSHFFRSLCQDIRTHLNAYESRRWERPFYLEHIMLIDGDKVEQKNLGNQIFEPQEIGEYKSQMLAERYGEFYGLEVLRSTSYIHDVSELESLMPIQQTRDSLFLPVLVGMVDNNGSRQVIDTFFRSD